MKKQIQGIALILLAILLNLAYGNETVGDLSLSWHTLFTIMGIYGAVMTFLPENKD